MESDTKEILKERDAPLRIFIPSARGWCTSSSGSCSFNRSRQVPHLADLQLESMKKFNLGIVKMSPAIDNLEEQLNVIHVENTKKLELEQEEVIQVMLRLHQANSSQK